MNYRIIIHPEAEDDLIDIYNWYEEQSRGLGMDFLRCIDASLNSIQHYPEMYQIIYKNIRRSFIRRFPYGIFYLIDEEKIVVLAVLHAKRDPKLWKKRISNYSSAK